MSLLSFSLAALIFAQGVIPEERPTLSAVRLNPDDRIAVDGKLGEPSWQRAPVAADFRQQDPANGEVSTERTEVRVLFNRDSLYIGVECFDSDPSGLLFNQMLRDGSLDADDRFIWVLDSYNTEQSAYYFEINPAGAMGDALVVPAQGGSFGSQLNRAWDGIWLAKVQRHQQGWTAEIQIPFKTLNFDPGAESWGANFQRTIRRKNEEALWSGFARNQGLLILTSQGRLTGIADVSQGAGLDIKPYLVGTYRQVPGGSPTATKGTGGVDFFYNMTPQLKANLTINTDFAQTEVDDRQVNLTRFSLFFPEKREFFLEGGRYFDFSREPNGFLSEFFSRRIGLDDNGVPQKIDYGIKLSGQVGRYDLGVMQVRTAAERGLYGEDFTILRPQRRLFRQSSMGMIYTRRSTRNSNLQARQSIGADFDLSTTRFRGSQNLQFAGHFAKTFNPLRRGDDNAYGWRISYPNDLWNMRFVYRTIEPNHAPAAGFVDRAGYHAGFGVFRFGPRPKNSRVIRQVAIQMTSQLFTDMRYKATDGDYRLTPVEITFQSGDKVSFQIGRSYDRLEKNFQIAKGITLPGGGTEYSWNRYELNLSSATRRKVSASTNLELGTFYSGRRQDFSTTLNVRPRRGLSAALTSQFNRIELREGSFSTKILRAIVNTQFSPWMSIANNIQYDTASRLLGWQIRFRWILQPGNDIYFVALNNWLDTGPHLTALDRNVTAKIVYTRRF